MILRPLASGSAADTDKVEAVRVCRGFDQRTGYGVFTEFVWPNALWLCVEEAAWSSTRGFTDALRATECR